MEYSIITVHCVGVERIFLLFSNIFQNEMTILSPPPTSTSEGGEW